MGKLSLAAGLGAGYVLGARAGRSRYDQISQGFSKLMSNPKVQQTKGTVQTQATGLIGKGKGKVTDKVESRKQGSDKIDSSFDVVEIPGSTTGSKTGTTSTTSTTGTTGTTGTGGFGTTGTTGTTGTSGFGTGGTTSSTDRPTSGL